MRLRIVLPKVNPEAITVPCAAYLRHVFQKRALTMAQPVLFLYNLSNGRWRKGFLYDRLLPDSGTDMLRSQHSYYKVLGRFSSVLMRVVDSGSHYPFRAANLSWKWRITRVFLPMCPIPFQKKPAPALDIQSLSACSHRVVQQSRCSMVLYVVSPYPPI